ncbi:MAG: hypothetical protein P8166_15445 [Candidatus Thiodiazotropha sp.]
MTREYLDPKQSIGVEPAADRNVERISTCCLDASPKMSFFLGKGRLGGAWWMIWMGMMGIVLAFPMSFYDGDLETGIPAYLTVCAMVIPTFGLSLLWPIHVWKKWHPIRFSRKTRKVYCHWYGKTYSEDWDSIKAYLKIQTDFNAQGAPDQVPQIHIEFHKEDGSVFTNPLIGLTGFGIGLSIEDKAAAAWEYIRRYMEEGPDQLPEPDLRVHKALSFDELLPENNPFPILRSERKWVWPFEIGLFFPLRCIWFLITYPTEVLYYLLDKKVKMNPFPAEMDEPCQCENEKVIWHPKMRLERRSGTAKQPKQRIPIIR